MGVEANVLRHAGMHEATLHRNLKAQRPHRGNFNRRRLIEIPVFFCIEYVNIPVIVVNGLILVYPQAVPRFVLFQHLTAGCQIEKACKASIRSHIHVCKRRGDTEALRSL